MRWAAVFGLWLDAYPKRAALLAGALLPFSFAPFFILPVFYLAYGIVFALALRASVTPRAGFVYGWVFGFGQFFVGLIWMGEAFLVEAEQFLWALPFAVTLLPAGLALFPAVALASLRALTHRLSLTPMAAVLVLAAMLALAAYLRSHILTGLPWNLPVMGWASWLYLAQPVSLMGIHALGLLALISAGLLLQKGRARLIAIALPLLAFGFSLWSLHMAPTPAATALRVIILQPHIAQREKWVADKREAHIEKTLRLTRLAVAQSPDVDLVIWPETALPALIDEGSGFADRLAAQFPADRKAPYLLTGAIRRDMRPLQANGAAIFNSAMLWSGDGLLLARSDKHHLVPFGEYLPLQSWLEATGLQQLTRIRGGFTPGAPHARLTAAGLPMMAPLICYEAIFPALSAGEPRPDVLINLTNDGWFGRSIGPHQHLALARLRAIEQGLPLLRSANTGMSAAYDARGRLLDGLALGETGSLALRLPAALPPPLYARLGDGGFFALIALVLLFAWRDPLQKRLRPRQP